MSEVVYWKDIRDQYRPKPRTCQDCGCSLRKMGSQWICQQCLESENAEIINGLSQSESLSENR